MRGIGTEGVPFLSQQAVEIEVCPMAGVVQRLASLDALQGHAQLFHQSHGFHSVYGFRVYLMGVQLPKGGVNQRFAGLVGVALPPVAAVKIQPISYTPGSSSRNRR